MTITFPVSYILSCKQGTNFLALSWSLKTIHIQGTSTRIMDLQESTIITNLFCSFAKIAGFQHGSIKRGVASIRNQCHTESKKIHPHLALHIAIAYRQLSACNLLFDVQAEHACGTVWTLVFLSSPWSLDRLYYYMTVDIVERVLQAGN